MIEKNAANNIYGINSRNLSEDLFIYLFQIRALVPPRVTGTRWNLIKALIAVTQLMFIQMHKAVKFLLGAINYQFA